MSARKSSVKLIGSPMKMAKSITTIITMPRSSIPVMSDLELLAVLELAPEADLVDALHRLGDALHHEQERRERDRGAERPHDRAPDALHRALAGDIGMDRAVDADPHEEDHGREEKHQVRDQVDDALAALREFLPEDVGAHVRALVERVAAGEHE